MNQEDEDADEPLIGEVAENDEKSGKAVVESILKKVAFGTDKDVSKETTEMLSKLQDVEDLHLESHINYFGSHFEKSIGSPSSSQPCRHKGSFLENTVSPQGTHQIVDAGIAPLH